MKKLLFAVCCVSFIGLSFTNVENAEISEVKTEVVVGSSFKLVNDTGGKVKIYTGSGYVSLNSGGGSTSIACNIGKDVSANGSYIFTISNDHCGRTIKLSNYM